MTIKYSAHYPINFIFLKGAAGKTASGRTLPIGSNMKTEDWIKNFERNLPEGFPVVAMGWPEAEYGICHENYINYCSDAVNETPDGESVPLLPTFEEWKRKERGGISYDLGFSQDYCDTCGSLPGIRYAATAMPSDHADKDYVALSVCEDCAQYIANGETPIDCED